MVSKRSVSTSFTENRAIILLITATIGFIAEKKLQLKALGTAFILFLIAAVIWIFPARGADPDKGLVGIVMFRILAMSPVLTDDLNPVD